MENCGAPTLTEDQQANLSKLPCHVNRGHGAVQWVELLCKGLCQQKGLCTSPKETRPGRWPGTLQLMGKNLGHTCFNVCATLTEISTQSVQLQYHSNSWEFSLMLKITGTVQITMVLAAPLCCCDSPEHGSEEGMNGRQMCCNNLHAPA